MSRNFLKVFRKDINTSHGDLVTLYSPKIPLPKILGRVADWVESMQNVATRIENRFSWMLSDEPKTLDADNVEFLTSPESSMVGLMAFIESAQETLDVELMSFNPMWGKTGEVSPLFNAIVAAAKRGVKIRVLVNDSTVFGGDNDPEMKLLAMLENVAKENHLPIQAAIDDLPKMKVKYIHNKGALADGYKTLISSINWNQNSVENNRETAISVDSRSINEHYQSIFNWDWQASH
jgi:phosphatidylserine/phosphatidylglycerophosphate/cardiolipin synthase-like enzyme